MDTKEIFSGRAEDYTAGRPSYPEALIDMLYDEIGFTSHSVIADIGSGTGKFAKQLLEKGSFVTCVEPNDDMRRIARRELSSYTKAVFTDGDSDNTGICTNSVNFITAAQSFHWFDTDKFKIESGRILKPGGKVVLIWNVRDETRKINMECHALFTKYCPKFLGFSGGIKKDDKRIVRFFDGKYAVTEFDNPLTFSRDKFLSRCLSASYSLSEGDPEFDDYIVGLNTIFDKYCKDDLLLMPNKTAAYIGGI